MQSIEKPKDGEFPPYANMYIQLLPDDGLLLKHLKNNFIATKQLILPLPEDKLNYRYAENKWTIKEILVHIIDDERILLTGHYVLQEMTKLNCRVLNKTIMSCIHELAGEA